MDQLEIHKAIEKLIAEAETEVEELLAKRLESILSDLNKLYAKFVTSDESSYTDLNKYNRLSKELERIAQQLNEDYRKIVKMIEYSNQRIYVENYLMLAYLFEVYQSTEMGFSIPSEDVVAAALINPIEFLTLPKILENHRNEIIRKLHIEISQSLLSGEGYWKMAKRIENAVGFSQKKARLVARTEGGRAMALADDFVTEQASKYCNITKVWLSALDHRVRISHRKLDGKESDKNGFFHYNGMKSTGPHMWGVAKMDINCRCVTIKKINGQIPSVRRGRDYRDDEYQEKLANKIDELMADEGMTYAQALNQAIKVVQPPSKNIPYQTYEEWKKKYM